MKIRRRSTVINNSPIDCGKIVQGSHRAVIVRSAGYSLALDNFGTIYYLRLGLLNDEILQSEFCTVSWGLDQIYL